MKNKFASCILSVCLIFTGLFMLTACVNENYDTNCQHDWHVCLQPTQDHSGEVICEICFTSIELPKLSSSKYQVSNTNPDYIVYTYTKNNHTFNIVKANFEYAPASCGGYQIFNYTGSSSSVVIPEKIIVNGNEEYVTAIGDNTFSNNTTLNSITLPAGLEEIGYRAFEGCSNLTSINLQEGFKKIGFYAFLNSGITEIVIPDSVTEIEANAFDGCSSLEKVVLGDNIDELKDYTFKDCTALDEVDLGTSVQTLGEGCFKNCASLVEIILPADIVGVNINLFEGCESLDKVYYLGNMKDCYFKSDFDKDNPDAIQADLCYYSTELSDEDKIQIAYAGELMWYYDDENNKVFWQATKTYNVYGKYYECFKTEVTITDEYWATLKQAEENNTLDEIFGDDQEQIDMVINSTTKVEYESKLSVLTERFISFGTYVEFSSTDGWTAHMFWEVDNVVYYNILGEFKEITINLENDTLSHIIEEEGKTTTHTYKLRIIED